MAIPPTSTGVLHVGNACAAWVRSEPGSGGMGASGGWRTRCGVLALPLWREVDHDEAKSRGVCCGCTTWRDGRPAIERTTTARPV